ncbi:hypothetical protein SCUP234_05001 [Seiridium cupressi]
MQLYYSPTTCATAVHIVLIELGIHHTPLKVPLKDDTHPITVKFREISPMAHFPVLLLDDGTVLTQMIAVLMYLADLVPEKRLFPPASDLNQRAGATRWLSFLAADVHTRLATEWPWTTLLDDDAIKRKARSFWEQRLGRRLAILNEQLEREEWILGEYTVADPYLFVILGWAEPTSFSL